MPSRRPSASRTASIDLSIASQIGILQSIDGSCDGACSRRASRTMLVALLVACAAESSALRAAPQRLQRRAPAARAAAEAIREPMIRLGHGYDIHRLDSRENAGQPIVIAGVRFDGSPGHAPDFELGCVAHSDGDVIYHSVVDAILGALTMPDIGCLFPDNDPRLRGADSSIFMEESYKRMVARDYRIGNCDVTLI